jgi:hypothetical protein
MKKRRKDLEKAKFEWPESAVGHKLVPRIPVLSRAQKLYYKNVVTAATTTKNRTKGTALTSTTLTDADLDYSLDLIEKRVGMPYELSEEHGMPFADKAGAQAVKKTMYKTYENDVATLFIGGAAASLDVDVTVAHSNSIIDAVEANVEALKAVKGRLVFITNRKTFNIIMKKAEIIERLAFTGVIPKDGRIIRGLKPEVLAEVLGVDEVVVGDNDNWLTDSGANDMTGRASIAKIPAEDLALEDLMLDPYGHVRLEMQPGDGENPFEIRTWDNDDDQVHQYDGKGYNKLTTLNSECAKSFENIAADA